MIGSTRRFIDHILAFGSALSLALCICLSGTIFVSDAQGGVSEKEEILAAAERDLQMLLGMLPTANLEDYGFRDTHEFRAPELEDPIRICAIDRAKLLAGAPVPTTLTGILQLYEMWYVPVVVDGEYRCIVFVRKIDGEYMARGIGSVLIARQLGEFRKSLVPTVPTPEYGSITFIDPEGWGVAAFRYRDDQRELLWPFPLHRPDLGLQEGVCVKPSDVLPKLRARESAAPRERDAS